MNETEQVKKIVQAYVDGVVNFNFPLAESAWHPEGLKISYDTDKNTLSKLTISQTRPNINQDQITLMKEKISQSGCIESVDVTSDIAFVKLVWQYERDEESKIITDYILLKRIDSEWKIVAKVYYESNTVKEIYIHS